MDVQTYLFSVFRHISPVFGVGCARGVGVCDKNGFSWYGAQNLWIGIKIQNIKKN
jgi:hypothetical protein